MNRDWISTKKPGDQEYDDGVKQFMVFAMKNSKGHNKIPCPCHRCHNIMHQKHEDIMIHLGKWAFDRTYTRWIWHGESSDESPTSFYGNDHTTDEDDRLEDMLRATQENFTNKPQILESLLSDSQQPLYPGCEDKHTRLSSILRLYNLKAGHGISDSCFGMILEVVKDLLPKDNVLPSTTYEAKKVLSTMAIPYEKIHACCNDCILYQNEYESLQSCPVCTAPRYKKNKEGVPTKTLWYFPIIPRFKRLFSNPEDAKLLTWHKHRRTKDGRIIKLDENMQHPADSPQWRFIDGKFRDFSNEERNLRLALSTDGMNPFGSLSSTYSTWPVILVTYNLPSWLCMKRKYMMLTLLISGPKQPGNDIDVYLAPLIDDLKFLWEKGVEVFDAHLNEMFNLRAMLFCTIQDFPAYGNLSGYTVKGKAPCPICEEGTKGNWLKASKKNVYLRHRRYLPYDHSYRRRKKAFNGKQELEGRPKVLSGVEVFEKVKDLQITFGKKNKRNLLPKQGYKKCSVFWCLPYWKDLFVRHSLDIMHIEKNVCEALLGTLLNIPGKTKDNVKSRDDLKEMGLRPELHVVDNGSRKYLPPAAHTLSTKERMIFCESLAGVKVPEGYSSNISKLVSMEQLRLIGLKSHDCHVLIQHLLPVAIRSILPKQVRYTIIRLCQFFNAICSKTINPKELTLLETEIVIILCQLEMYFPPSFFDIMIHLPIHLVREVRNCGPVYLRSQWCFERQMKTYKGYVKNYSRPEGCIAERVFLEDTVELCSEYLGDAMPIGLPLSRHSGRMAGKGTIGHKKKDMPHAKWLMAHTYILLQDKEVAPYVMEHKAELRRKNQKATEKYLAMEHSKSFSLWFKDKIFSKLQESSETISDRLKRLSFGPNFSASSYCGYVINGCTFYTKEQDDKSTMQNSGITLEAVSMHFASAKDKSPVYSKMQYYGVIKEIWELSYSEFSIAVFGCEWADTFEIDELGFVLVNFNKLGHKEDPFILASQARSVFYMTDPLDKRRSVVITPKSRHDIDDFDEDDEDIEMGETSFTKDGQREVLIEDDSVDETSSTYVRGDHNEGITIEGVAKKRGRKRKSRKK